MTLSLAQYRERWRADGVCTACGGRRASPGHVTCTRCRKEMARRDRERTARRQLDLRDVYFLRLDSGDGIPTGPVKVGSTSDLDERLRKLRATSPVPLLLVGVVRRGGVALEREIHRRFAGDRLHGEWFRASLLLLEVVDELVHYGPGDQPVA